MKWTAEQILEEYNKDRSHQNMKRIADENGVTMKEIGEFLKNEAAKNTPAGQKKKGRPKGTATGKKSQKRSGAENTLNDTKEEKEIKSDSCPRKIDLGPVKEDIPGPVRKLITDQLNTIEVKMSYHQEALDDLKKEKAELISFLTGGDFDGNA